MAFDCGWSLALSFFINPIGALFKSHGVAEINRVDLGNLNPINERELNKPDVHQNKGEVQSVYGGGGGQRVTSQMYTRTRGMCKVSMEGEASLGGQRVSA